MKKSPVTSVKKKFARFSLYLKAKCLNFRSIFVLAGLVLSSQVAFAITRIGNSRFGSTELGFEGSISKPFVFLRQIENDGALLISMGDGILRDGEPLIVKPLRSALGGIEALSRSEFREIFEESRSLQNIFVDLQPNDYCVEAFSGPWTSKESTHVGVASWGQGKGIIVYGSNGKVVRASVRDILRNLEVSEEACAWE